MMETRGVSMAETDNDTCVGVLVPNALENQFILNEIGLEGMALRRLRDRE